MGKIIAAIIAAALLAGGLATVAVENSSQHAQIIRSQREVTSLSHEISNMRAEINSESGEISSLETPADPLSAYNDICNQDMTNDNTGISQTYYFPCTNEAQTIPQPGN